MTRSISRITSSSHYLQVSPTLQGSSGKPTGWLLMVSSLLYLRTLCQAHEQVVRHAFSLSVMMLKDRQPREHLRQQQVQQPSNPPPDPPSPKNSNSTSPASLPRSYPPLPLTTQNDIVSPPSHLSAQIRPSPASLCTSSSGSPRVSGSLS